MNILRHTKLSQSATQLRNIRGPDFSRLPVRRRNLSTTEAVMPRGTPPLVLTVGIYLLENNISKCTHYRWFFSLHFADSKHWAPPKQKRGAKTTCSLTKSLGRIKITKARCKIKADALYKTVYPYLHHEPI